jgi:hypothetical protein
MKESHLDNTPSIPFHLSDKELKYFISIFGDHLNGTTMHDHGLCAAVRWYAQQDMEKRIRSTNPDFLLDICGSARQPNDRKWSMMPVITHSDHFRRRPFNSCNCKDDCYHVPQHAAMIVDVVYYLNPESIADVCSRTSDHALHSLHHSFRTMFGSVLCDTYKWAMDGPNVLIVVGSEDIRGHTYVHSNMLWLRSGPWKTSYGWLSYEPSRFYGPMEYGTFLLSSEEPLCRPHLGVHIKEVSVFKEVNCGFLSHFGYHNHSWKHVLLDEHFYEQCHNYVLDKGRSPTLRRDLWAFIRRYQTNPENMKCYRNWPRIFNEMVVNTLAYLLQNDWDHSFISDAIYANQKELSYYNKFNPFEPTGDSISWFGRVCSFLSLLFCSFFWLGWTPSIILLSVIFAYGQISVWRLTPRFVNPSPSLAPVDFSHPSPGPKGLVNTLYQNVLYPLMASVGVTMKLIVLVVLLSFLVSLAMSLILSLAVSLIWSLLCVCVICVIFHQLLKRRGVNLILILMGFLKPTEKLTQSSLAVRGFSNVGLVGTHHQNKNGCCALFKILVIVIFFFMLLPAVSNTKSISLETNLQNLAPSFQNMTQTCPRMDL